MSKSNLLGEVQWTHPVCSTSDPLSVQLHAFDRELKPSVLHLLQSKMETVPLGLVQLALDHPKASLQTPAQSPRQVQLPALQIWQSNIGFMIRF
jgi:hypothetical protein